MKICFLVPYVPTLIRARPYNLIRSLSARGNQVTVMTLWSDDAERAALEELKTECSRVLAFEMPKWRSFWNCLAALPGRVPLQAVYSWQPALDRQLHALVEAQEADIVHVEHLRGVRYGLSLKSGRNGGPPLPVVWDSVDSISHLFRQAAAQNKKPVTQALTRLELGRTERYEGFLTGQFDRMLVTSPADRWAFLSINGSPSSERRITVLPNGVDLSYFTPGDDSAREPETLVISGKMSYHANVSMVLYLVQRIMPAIWASRPNVKLWIVGKDPPGEIRDLGLNPAVLVTGTVDDVRPFLKRAAVAVAPLRYGAGIQNKVLEAMACATPVVSTPQAVSALSVRPGREALVAEDPGEFAEKVLCLLDDVRRQRQLGQAGRSFVEANHCWEAIASRLEEIYREVIVAKERNNARKQS
jgi:sugar transferase (PEP-CTERM/EpsH1 system associated)